MSEAALPIGLEIAELRWGWGVARLEAFGSAATGAFRVANSDLDCLVELLPG